MSWWAWILLPLAGGFGAYGRWRTETALRGFWPTVSLANNPGILPRTRLAWPIMLINLVGSFLAGIFAGILPSPWLFILGVGLLGGWTTFSTAMLDLYQLATSSLSPGGPDGKNPANSSQTGWRKQLGRDLLATFLCALLGFFSCVSAALAGIWLVA